MWWYFVKQSEDESVVEYSYGFESREQSGLVKCYKEDETFDILRLADNDSMKLAERFMLRHLYKVVFVENCPQERQVAIG